jgi:cell division protein FtsZ
LFVAALSEHVDAILVINNEKLKEIYPDLELFQCFCQSRRVLTNAAKGIAEIITIPGYINTDFAMYTVS